MAKRRRKSKPGWLSYERRHDELAPRSVFIKRVIAALVAALGLIAVALVIGIAGYHYTAGFNWIDSLLEASMILGGMGPANQLPNDGAKIFASIYALFSGLMAWLGQLFLPGQEALINKLLLGLYGLLALANLIIFSRLSTRRMLISVGESNSLMVVLCVLAPLREISSCKARLSRKDAEHEPQGFWTSCFTAGSAMD